MTEVPVAYVVFNRPQHTARTFSALRKQQPKELFIIADGPRPGHATDAERCAQVRAIVERIDWPCDVRRNYAECNLGLKRRVSTGLDWVFSQVDQVIVLEDDCLPHTDFFNFCGVLLERYAEDERVWVITGNNFQDGRKRGDASYYFSKYNHCWGWATWRRAWQHYEGQIPFWHEWRDSRRWHDINPYRVERQYWEEIFTKVYKGGIDSWAYPWTASVWYHQGLTATPNVNLVTNIGIGPDASHTVTTEDQEGIPLVSLGPLTHPAVLVNDWKADRYAFLNHFGGKSRGTANRLLRLPRLILKNIRNSITNSIKV